MPAQKDLQPALSTEDQSWRKRPVQLVASKAPQSAKRFKTDSPTSSRHMTGLGTLLPQVSSTRSSSNSRMKAERWFDETNEHPKEVSFFDDDPPYFIKNEPSDNNSICATQSENSLRDVSKIGPTAPTRSLLAQMNADNDNGEAFRGVIDDLTVQNKKLKRRLKKYEALHCSHLQEQKLFEVRVHGLPANRKRELEETLRSFASSINEGSHAYPQVHGVTASALQKSSSSSTSASKLQGDSAYASMSGRIGVTSLSHLTEQPQNRQANRQNIKSYLHGIPANLAPEQAIALSDRSKSKTIVRRLEQIFTGRGAESRQYGQTQLQQEVSQSAALAFNQPLNHEGTREAHMLAHDSELPIDASGDVKTQASSRESNPRSLQASGSGSPRSPEQRPTRPLDLDLHREQIPSDNIEYIRHLAVSSTGHETLNDPESKDGWVWLNLLTSMAQLHTLNVTPEFIRKAITDFSSKFELSSDKTKIRWLGGTTGTRMSSDGDDSEYQMSRKPPSNPAVASVDDALERTSAQAHVSSEPSTIPATGAKRRPVNLNESMNGSSTFHYKPLFFHTALSDEDESEAISDSANTDGSPGIATGINSNSTAQHGRVSRSGGRRRNDGPMIFYNGANFCTDLSGDLNGTERRQSNYRLVTEKPVGSFDFHTDERGESDGDVKYAGSQHSGSQDETASSVDCALNLDDLKSSISSLGGEQNSQKDGLDMEASGLGGIQPEDNFVVKVRVRHQRKKSSGRKLPSFTKPKSNVRKILHNIPRSSIDAFHTANSNMPRSQRTEPSVNGEIISAVKIEMLPSALPPASYLHLPFSSSGSDTDLEDYYEHVSTNLMTTDYAPALHPVMNPIRYSSFNTASHESDTGSDSDDDSSIDLLAHARGVEPETIAAREREFESNNGAILGGVTDNAVKVGSGNGNEESDIDSMSVGGEGSEG